ncbi:MAG: hypothetical protein FWH27_11870 [Planctomycetaceae bacterium]|nr:hypothetical protein [Planctomycetaceae bacterium]
MSNRVACNAHSRAVTPWLPTGHHCRKTAFYIIFLKKTTTGFGRAVLPRLPFLFHHEGVKKCRTQSAECRVQRAESRTQSGHMCHQRNNPWPPQQTSFSPD